MKPELRNSLREFIKSPAGAELLGLLINQELALEAEATKKDVTIDRQVQLFNKKQGVYWVRTLISDLIDARNGK